MKHTNVVKQQSHIFPKRRGTAGKIACTRMNFMHLLSGVWSCPVCYHKQTAKTKNNKRVTLERGFWICGHGTKSNAMNNMWVSMAYPALCSAVVNNATIFCLLNAGVLASHIYIFTGSPTNSNEKNVHYVKYGRVPGHPIWSLQFCVHLMQKKWHTVWVM